MEWTAAYLQVRNEFCKRCETGCSEKKKLTCIEQFLWIVSIWESSNDNTEDDNDK